MWTLSFSQIWTPLPKSTNPLLKSINHPSHKREPPSQKHDHSFSTAWTPLLKTMTSLSGKHEPPSQKHQTPHSQKHDPASLKHEPTFSKAWSSSQNHDPLLKSMNSFLKSMNQSSQKCEPSFSKAWTPSQKVWIPLLKSMNSFAKAWTLSSKEWTSLLWSVNLPLKKRESPIILLLSYYWDIHAFETVAHIKRGWFIFMKKGVNRKGFHVNPLKPLGYGPEQSDLWDVLWKTKKGTGMTAIWSFIPAD